MITRCATVTLSFQLACWLPTTSLPVTYSRGSLQGAPRVQHDQLLGGATCAVRTPTSLKFQVQGDTGLARDVCT